jgi:hypothetical protein
MVVNNLKYKNMKNLLYLVSVLMLISIKSTYAQDTNFKKPLVYANKQSYDVTEITNHIMIIRNTNNHIFKSGTNTSAKTDRAPATTPKPSDSRYDKAAISQIFYNDFTENRLKQLADENLTILINFNTDINGNVLELGFTFGDNSTLMPVEIEKLESQLQKQIKFNINAKAFKGSEYIPLFISVDFKRLFNHAPNAVFP